MKRKSYEKPVARRVRKNSLVFKLVENLMGHAACRQCSSCHDCK